MNFDPTKFSIANIVDTCSVWSILSSQKLYQAAKNAKIHFCITPMVLYECLYKPRSSMDSEQSELINRLETARSSGDFPDQSCDIEDLATIARTVPNRLGSGEISCIATAYKIRNISFMTDEKNARKFASKELGLNVETTPKLYAWLHYRSYLKDKDHNDVIIEHETYERKIPLTKFLNLAFKEATRCRQMEQK